MAPVAISAIATAPPTAPPIITFNGVKDDEPLNEPVSIGNENLNGGGPTLPVGPYVHPQELGGETIAELEVCPQGLGGGGVANRLELLS